MGLSLPDYLIRLAEGYILCRILINVYELAFNATRDAI